MKLLRVCVMTLIIGVACLGAEADGQEDLSFFFQQNFPHIAVGGPWSTRLTFVNVGSNATEFPLAFFKQNGEPWAVTTADGETQSVFMLSLPLFGSMDIELPSPGPEIQIGWAQIVQPANSTIAGHAIFRDNGGPGRPIPFEAVVPLSLFSEGDSGIAPGFRVTFLPFDNTNGFNTCMALANPSNANTTQVAILLVDGDQLTEVADEDVVLPPLNQTAFCIREQLPFLEGKKGVLFLLRPLDHLTLSILAFRFDPQGSFTTFFPMWEQ